MRSTTFAVGEVLENFRLADLHAVVVTCLHFQTQICFIATVGHPSICAALVSCIAVSRFRERVGLQCVKEAGGDDVGGGNDVTDSQTGVYDNVENVQQQQTAQHRRSRRDQYVLHAAAVGAAHDDAGGTVTVGDGGAAAGAIRTETATSNSLSSGDVDGWTTGVRRRGRCADRQASNRVVGPSFVSSARVQLGGFEVNRHQQIQQQPQHHHHQQQQQQHSEQFLSSSNSVDVRSTTTQLSNNDDATSTTIGQHCNQTSGSKLEPPWIGYDNIVELNEAIHSSAAAKMAAGSRTKSAVATSTTVSGGGLSSADEGLSSDRVHSGANRVIGERVVDVRRQRLTAARREPTTAAQTSAASRTEAAAWSSTPGIVASPEMEVTPTTSADAEQMQDQRANSEAAPSDVGGPHPAHTDSHLTNGGLRHKEKTVTFDNEFANSGKTKAATDNGRKRKTKDKPPIVTTGNDPYKKVEKKSERRRENREQKSAAGSEAVSEEPDRGDGKTVKSANKMSFLKSLLTRSRSPSPKRGTSSSNGRSESPLSVGRDVAKRLSDPLKSSFKQSPDAPVVKVSVKRDEKKRKQHPAGDAKNDRQTSHTKDNSNCKEVSAVNYSDERVEKTLASADEVKPSLPSTQDDHIETSLSSMTSATVNSSCSVERRDVKNTSPSPAACQSADVVTTASVLPASETVGTASSTSGVVEQSSERRRSATIITLRSAASGGSESATHGVPVDQTAATLTELHNPWLVNLREFRLPPKLDRFEGEKVFRKGTATTRLLLPGFAGSRQEFLAPCDGELRPEALQRLTTTQRKPPSDRRDRHSAIASPIYDTVYEEQPSTIYKSTTALTGSGYQSQRANDVEKALSLQDLKVRAGARQTSTVTDDAVTAGRTRTATTTEHAIDDDEWRNCTGHISRDRGDRGSSPTKPIKTVTFSDNVDDNCSSTNRHLESVHGLSKPEPLTDEKASRDVSVAFSESTLPLPVNRSRGPVAGFTDTDRCEKMSKSSSLPGRGQPTIHSNPVDLRSNVVSALRDTITSIDLEDLPKYLADMYKQQKLERQREQELAARDRERLENIEKMWKEFESGLTVSASDASHSTNAASTEGTGDRAASHINTENLQRKPRQQVLVNKFVTLLVSQCRKRNSINEHRPHKKHHVACSFCLLSSVNCIFKSFNF